MGKRYSIEDWKNKIIKRSSAAGRRGIRSNEINPDSRHLLFNQALAYLLDQKEIIPLGINRPQRYFHRSVIEEVYQSLRPKETIPPPITESLLRQWYQDDVIERRRIGLHSVLLVKTLRRYRQWAQEHRLNADIGGLHEALKRLSSEGKAALLPTSKPKINWTPEEHEAFIPIGLDNMEDWYFVDMA
ncbi:MAG: hypothetical protein L0Y62_01335 [Nitrospirae bacterium]|nr:hypothetical protein [Nitrospirota bacterium]